MTTDEFLSVLDKHEAKCFERRSLQKQADDMKARRLGTIYAEVDQLWRLCATQRAIVRNELTRLTAMYGQDDVAWCLRQVAEDAKNAK